MIEILECRELTDKEKRKYDIQQEIEKKKRELEELKSLESEVNTCDKKEDYDSKHHGKERLQQKIGSLSAEDEKIVSEAIKKDNQKDALTDEELNEIRERSRIEYENITSDIKFSPKKAFIFMVIMIGLVIICTIFGSKGKDTKDIMHEAMNNDEEIVIEVELE